MKKGLSLAVAVAGACLAAVATDFVWTGGGNDGLWTTSANWNAGGGVPFYI